MTGPPKLIDYLGWSAHSPSPGANAPFPELLQDFRGREALSHVEQPESSGEHTRAYNRSWISIAHQFIRSVLSFSEIPKSRIAEGASARDTGLVSWRARPEPCQPCAAGHRPARALPRSYHRRGAVAGAEAKPGLVAECLIGSEVPVIWTCWRKHWHTTRPIVAVARLCSITEQNGKDRHREDKYDLP